MRVPWGYSTTYRSVAEIRVVLMEHYHPEYVDRLCAWLMSKGGLIGVGGTWRADGTQADKPGFAPEGKSFHQNQKYSDGFIGACAVDLVAANSFGVHRAPGWAEVPAQGSLEASRWGVHCNVGTPGQSGSEPWHMQPVEIDGHSSWLANGSPAPRPNYPFPGRFTLGDVVVTSLTFKKDRLLDTRLLGSRTTEGQVINVSAPTGAKAVKINVTVTDGIGPGFVSVFPHLTQRPSTSDVNYNVGQTIANQVDVPVNAGQFSLYVLTPAHVIVDLVGFWT